MKFEEINLRSELSEAIKIIGYENMTPIQEEAIPVIIDGNDVICQAQTGTGKTACFAIPILERINEGNKVEALIIAPTRELANQIEEDFVKLSQKMEVKMTSLIGGVKYEYQERALAKKPNVVIATPGRAKDMIEKKKLKLSDVKYFVLDEADEMLKVGFKEEIDFIISNLNHENVQSMLFSATQTEDTLALAEKLLKDPVSINRSTGLTTSKNVKQKAMMVREGDKLKILTRILDMNKDSLFIVFCRTKRRSDELSLVLNELGYTNRALHGDLVQSQRDQVIKGFKAKTFDILVCTDVAARGLDISGVEFVINFDLPELVEYYVHRIGRSGRAENIGTSISFVRDVEIPYMEKIALETKSEIEYVPQPSKKQVKRALVQRLYDKVKQGIEKDTSAMEEMANNLIEEFGANKVVEALLDIASDKVHKAIPQIKPEPAVIINRPKRRFTRVEVKKVRDSKKARQARNASRDNKDGYKNDFGKRRHDDKRKQNQNGETEIFVRSKASSSHTNKSSRPTGRRSESTKVNTRRPHNTGKRQATRRGGDTK